MGKRDTFLHMVDFTDYIMLDGLRVFVHDGISRGASFGTFFRKPLGSLKRLQRKQLPMRPTRPQAQKDLDAYAEAFGWKAVQRGGQTEK